jgi:excisionase family DNA binding protein
MEKKNLTVQEAADMLNVRRERIWKLMNDGVLTAHPSRLDGRQKLIPREQVEALLLEEGYRPRRTVGRRIHDAPEPEYGDGVRTATRPWPRSIGMVSDGMLSSSESEAYMREQLHGEPVEAE